MKQTNGHERAINHMKRDVMSLKVSHGALLVVRAKRMHPEGSCGIPHELSR
jgi:hypothetical protein